MATTDAVRTFAAIAYNEVLLNSKRVAPYALLILFSALAVMGWFKGPAVAFGWATNSDFYISRGLKAFSFLFGVPIVNAMIMGDPVIRDFRLGIDPLIFSKPLGRVLYLLGKFVGNFSVLTCCLAAFPLTMMALQVFRPSRMIVQPVIVLPCFKHFFLLVVITQLSFAAFFFMVGTLTRNNKIVYLLAVCSYPVFIATMVVLPKGLMARRDLLDPFLLSSGPSGNGFGNSAEYLNQYVFSYTPDMIWNRAGMILGAVLCLTWLYLRFTTAENSHKQVNSQAALPGQSTASEHVSYQHSRRKNDLFKSSFFTIFWNEVLLNSKRIAPYIMALLCAGCGLLWWGWGPFIGRGVAVNSDFAIAGILPPYSFLLLPIFTALFMADPVNRDFRLGIDPLIFSKPVSRAQYLLGKFFGNFFVLACCQSAMVITWFLLQAVPKKNLVTLPGITIIPYIKHFLVLVVISHLGLAAFYFAVGVLTRNPKIVYGLGVAFYPIYMTYLSMVSSALGIYWKLALDPLVLNRGDVHVAKVKAEFVNQLVVTYAPDLIINRVVMVLLAAICLTIVYLRFSSTERSEIQEKLSVLNLSTAADRVYHQGSPPLHDFVSPASVVIPDVTTVNQGIRESMNKLIGSLGVEFRLLGAERGLVVVIPLTIFLSVMEVAFYKIPTDVSQSAAYATNTANVLLLFLIGVSIFYTGEAMHRDREIKIEPVVWATPASNRVLLLSKFLTTTLLSLSLVTVVGVIAIVIQLMRGHTPVDISAYEVVYGVVLAPSIIFLTSLIVALNVVLRNKYAAYVVAVGAGVGLFYLYNLGYKHWLYNPLLYRSWTYSDLTSGRILMYRFYCLTLAAVFMLIAHVFFERKSGSI